MMDKREAASIILDCISRRVVMRWEDCQAVTAAVDEALNEIARRRQEDGPEAVEMMGGVIRDVVLCPGNPG